MGTFTSMDRVLLAAVLVLLWLRPYGTGPPESWLVDIGVFILLFLSWPWIRAAGRRVDGWIDARWPSATFGTADEDRAQTDIPGWLPPVLILAGVAILGFLGLLGAL